MNSNPTMHLPPHDVEAECAVLGAILIEPGAYQKVAYLTSEMFYDPRNRKVFEGIISLFSQSKPIDFITLRNQLIADKLFDEQGAMYIFEVANCVCTSSTSKSMHT